MMMVFLVLLGIEGLSYMLNDENRHCPKFCVNGNRIQL